MSDNKNNCVFCKFEDGSRCSKWNYFITGNMGNPNVSSVSVPAGYDGVVYLDQKKCRGFKLAEGMKEQWKTKFGRGWFS